MQTLPPKNEQSINSTIIFNVNIKEPYVCEKHCKPLTFYNVTYPWKKPLCIDCLGEETKKEEELLLKNSVIPVINRYIPSSQLIDQFFLTIKSMEEIQPKLIDSNSSYEKYLFQLEETLMKFMNKVVKNYFSKVLKKLRIMENKIIKPYPALTPLDILNFINTQEKYIEELKNKKTQNYSIINKMQTKLIEYHSFLEEQLQSLFNSFFTKDTFQNKSKELLQMEKDLQCLQINFDSLGLETKCSTSLAKNSYNLEKTSVSSFEILSKVSKIEEKLKETAQKVKTYIKNENVGKSNEKKNLSRNSSCSSISIEKSFHSESNEEKDKKEKEVIVNKQKQENILSSTPLKEPYQSSINKNISSTNNVYNVRKGLYKEYNDFTTGCCAKCGKKCQTVANCEKNNIYCKECQIGFYQNEENNNKSISHNSSKKQFKIQQEELITKKCIECNQIFGSPASLAPDRTMCYYCYKKANISSSTSHSNYFSSSHVYSSYNINNRCSEKKGQKPFFFKNNGNIKKSLAINFSKNNFNQFNNGYHNSKISNRGGNRSKLRRGRGGMKTQIKRFDGKENVPFNGNNEDDFEVNLSKSEGNESKEEEQKEKMHLNKNSKEDYDNLLLDENDEDEFGEKNENSQSSEFEKDF